MVPNRRLRWHGTNLSTERWFNQYYCTHRTVQVGSDPKAHPVPTPHHGLVAPQQLKLPSAIQPGTEHVEGWRTTALISFPLSEELLPNVQPNHTALSSEPEERGRRPHSPQPRPSRQTWPSPAEPSQGTKAADSPAAVPPHAGLPGNRVHRRPRDPALLTGGQRAATPTLPVIESATVLHPKGPRAAAPHKAPGAMLPQSHREPHPLHEPHALLTYAQLTPPGRRPFNDRHLPIGRAECPSALPARLLAVEARRLFSPAPPS